MVGRREFSRASSGFAPVSLILGSSFVTMNYGYRKRWSDYRLEDGGTSRVSSSRTKRHVFHVRDNGGAICDGRFARLINKLEKRLDDIDGHWKDDR
jgi:hypothetical protein